MMNDPKRTSGAIAPETVERERLSLIAVLAGGWAPGGLASAAPSPSPSPSCPAVPSSPSDARYPPPGLFRHGDIVFPRRIDVNAISTVPDLLRVLKLLSSASWSTDKEQSQSLEQILRSTLTIEPAAAPAKNGVKPQSIGPSKTGKPPFDLVKFWPVLMGLLAEVRDGKKSLDDFLKEVVTALGGPSALKDASEAIFAKQYVGHCGIIDLSDAADPWVVESSHTHGGMHCVRYADWEAERMAHKALVWVYRLQALEDVTDAQDCAALAQRRAAFVDVAHRCRMQGIPYAIFDSKVDGAKFELDMCRVRDVGELPYLYCSELVYFCAREALGIEVASPSKDCKAAGLNFGMVTPGDLTKRTDRFVRKSGSGDYIPRIGGGPQT